MSWVGVGGVRLYYEWRGEGPSVLFISGASGDAGHWTGVADALATQYTVVTYDRRGNSRSPRPADWTGTTIEEQAEDAAGLLEALDLAPAIVFGTSAAAGILAGVSLQRPEVVRGAIFHEPVFPSGFPSMDTVQAARRDEVAARRNVFESEAALCVGFGDSCHRLTSSILDDVPTCDGGNSHTPHRSAPAVTQDAGNRCTLLNGYPLERKDEEKQNSGHVARF